MYGIIIFNCLTNFIRLRLTAHLPHCTQTSGFQDGMLRARSRFSYLVVAVGSTPSQGFLETGRSSPLPLMISAVGEWSMGVPAHICAVGLYGRLRRPQLHSVMPKRKLFGATLVLHAILGAIVCAYACRSPPRTKPRCAGLVPKGSLSLTRMLKMKCIFFLFLSFCAILIMYF